MKKLLLFVLLIVGYVPNTTTNYYIGMTDQEFINNNPNLDKFENTMDVGNGFL